MIRSFTVRNFRCFRDFTFGTQEQPLARVNLIAGKNNTGKTALLEAVFLHLGPNNHALPLSLNAHRGIEQVDLDPEELWGWLFYRKQLGEVIELTSRRSDSRECVLKIRLGEPEAETIVSASGSPGNGAAKPQPVSGSLSTALKTRELILDYSDTTGPKGITRMAPMGLGFRVQQARIGPFPLGVFLSTHIRIPKEDAERFSKLEEVGQEGQVVQTLRLLETNLQRLTVLVSGGTPVIHGDTRAGRLVPLPLMGEGVVRLLSMALIIANAPNGFLLVDEIENGFHYSVMQDVWKALAQAARTADVQIFATTHSWECIQAAHRAFKESGSYDFRYHRLDRRGEGIVAKSFDEKMLDAVEKSDLEAR